MKDILQAQHYQLREIERYVQDTMPNLSFHNFFGHVKEVYNVAMALSTKYYLSGDDRFALGAGTLFHDRFYVVGAKDNEVRSAKDAAIFLEMLGVKKDVIAKSVDVILATMPDAKPKTLLEKIGKDADMHNVGTPYFMEANARVRAEFPKMSDSAWYAATLRNIGDFEFHTAPAKILYGSMWEDNKMNLEKLVENEAKKLLRSTAA